MDNENDVFRFEDFVDVDKIIKMKSELVKEGILSDDDTDEIDMSKNPYFDNSGIEDVNVDYDQVLYFMKDNGWGDSVMNNIEDFENSEFYSGTKDSEEYGWEFNKYVDSMSNGELDQEEDFDNQLDESKSDSDDNEYYKLYKDKAEDFTCDIAVEGVSQNDTEVRLIVESEDWTLMFNGEIKNGICKIPLKKLSILEEGCKGNIRLEVNADGTLFTPWKDTFIVKTSKKVTVKVNENKSTKKPISKNTKGVKVNIRK
jgi:hypothetical protein